MIANEPTKAGHLSLCAQSTFLILVEKHTMLCCCPRQPDYLMRGSGPRTWRTRANPFESVWPQVQRWLKEHPDAIAKDLFARLQEKMPGVFPPGQPRTLQRRVKQWCSEIARQLPFGLDSETEMDRDVCFAGAPSTPTRSAYAQRAGFQIDQTRREKLTGIASLSGRTRNHGKDGSVWLLRGTGTGFAVDQTVGMPIYWPAWKPD